MLVSKTKKRPVILFPRRRSPHRQAIAKAIKEMADLRKKDPQAYEALIKRSAGREVNIVPGYRLTSGLRRNFQSFVLWRD